MKLERSTLWASNVTLVQNKKNGVNQMKPDTSAKSKKSKDSLRIRNRLKRLNQEIKKPQRPSLHLYRPRS